MHARRQLGVDSETQCDLLAVMQLYLPALWGSRKQHITHSTARDRGPCLPHRGLRVHRYEAFGRLLACHRVGWEHVLASENLEVDECGPACLSIVFLVGCCAPRMITLSRAPCGMRTQSALHF
jgi:hypothetical protein